MPTSRTDSPEAFKRIALTGGIATGKSTVAKMFADLGAAILDADRVARQVVEPGTSCWRQLRARLGPEYFEEDGSLKRGELRRRIIRDSRCRSMVNGILHPSILQEMDRQCQALQAIRTGRIVLFDIPLLFEIDIADRFDTIILVYTSREIQLHRLMERDGLTSAEAAKTLDMQLPIDAKRAGSHLVIDNSRDLSHTRLQVKAVWEKLLRQGSL
jgi:dephospho-CoA kinase